MAKNNENNSPNSSERALDVFAETMIKHIEALQESQLKNSGKPWISPDISMPKNLDGRKYNGFNSFILMLHCIDQGYPMARFATFNALQRLNDPEKTKGANELPFVKVLKGEKSFPVLLTTVNGINKDTGVKIPYSDWLSLSAGEKEEYELKAYSRAYRVFNIAQTNLREARPELWEKFKKEDSRGNVAKGKDFTFEPLEVMMRDNAWICPINLKEQDRAFYSIKNNSITLPLKEQFRDGELFVGTVFHEMAHSTGRKDVFDRFNPSGLSKDAAYAKEELVAEMTAALACQNYGMTKHIKDESATYLKSWLSALKESPTFIKTVLTDVKKASGLIIENTDKISQEIAQGTRQGLTLRTKESEEMDDNKGMLFADDNDDESLVAARAAYSYPRR